jgi:hypothetical protein
VTKVVERDSIVLLQIERSRGDHEAVQRLEAEGAVHPLRGGGTHGWAQDPGGGDEAQALQAIAGRGSCSGGSMFWFFLMGLLRFWSGFLFFSLVLHSGDF